MNNVLITGCPRSGTTLALQVLCPKLTPSQLTAGSDVNEPTMLSDAIESGNSKRVAGAIINMMANPHRTVKHPFAAICLDQLTMWHEHFSILGIYRDLRQVVPSVFEHHNNHSVIGDDNLWKSWAAFDESMTKFERVMLLWQEAHLRIAKWPGKKTLWRYGMWHEWEVNARPTMCDSCETSQTIIDDVLTTGHVFSNKMDNFNAWGQLMHDGEISGKEEEQAEKAIETVVDAYWKAGMWNITL